LDLGSGKPFDEVSSLRRSADTSRRSDHGAGLVQALPSPLAPVGFSNWAHSGRSFGTAAIGEEAEVADAHEAAGKQVQEEAAQEFIDGQSHEPLLLP